MPGLDKPLSFVLLSAFSRRSASGSGSAAPFSADPLRTPQKNLQKPELHNILSGEGERDMPKCLKRKFTIGSDVSLHIRFSHIRKNTANSDAHLHYGGSGDLLHSALRCRRPLLSGAAELKKSVPDMRVPVQRACKKQSFVEAFPDFQIF